MSQDSSYFYYHGDMDSQSWTGQIGGLKLPSAGQIKVLVVFAQFPDDQYDINNVNWPKGGNPSGWQNWLDPSWTGNPTTGSLTDYFNQMSLGALKIIGEEVSLTTLQSRSWYFSHNYKRYEIHKEILQQQLDPTWDFASYDNWTFNGNYSHRIGPDGKIEFVFFIWRNVSMDENHWMSDLLFGWYGDIGQGPNIYVDNGNRYFQTYSYGSGCTVADYFYKDAFRFSIHEFAHYLIGGNEYHNGHAFWGMLSGYEVRSFMINAWERYRLGWCNIIPVNNETQTITNATLTDFITTGVAYRIEIDAATNQYIFIENHQKISHWDACSQFANDKGLFVYRQDGAYSLNGLADWLKFIPAEGRFDWNITQWRNDHGMGNFYLPVFQKLLPDRETGLAPTDFQYLLNPYTSEYKYYEVLLLENSGGYYLDPLRYGKGKDAFRIGYNQVFNPWSNPNSQKSDRTATGIGFSLISIDNGLALFNIYVNTSQDAPPSKPQGLQISVNGLYQPVLTWQANQETDMKYAGKYKIYRAWTTGSEPTTYALAATINAYNIKQPVTTWTDVDWVAGSGPDVLFYKISAVDNGLTESVKSDYASIPFNHIAQKMNSGTITAELEYDLHQNYPNPFNPVTTIAYEVKNSGIVAITISDILGTEIIKLVNEFKEKGSYQVSFDASKLPSGIYIYRCSINEFVMSRKMTLIK